MITEVDTNIVSAIISDELGAVELAHQLYNLTATDQLVISGASYAELLAHPRITPEAMDQALVASTIKVDCRADFEMWRVAGIAFRQYAQRRRRSGGGEPKRLLADFIVGAHASLYADRLFSLDRGRYSRDFPKLRLY